MVTMRLSMIALFASGLATVVFSQVAGDEGQAYLDLEKLRVESMPRVALRGAGAANATLCGRGDRCYMLE